MQDSAALWRRMPSEAMECIEKQECIYNYSEQAKDQIILDRFEFRYLANKVK